MKIQNPSGYKEGIAKAIDSFPGVKRRQDILFQSPNAIVMEDFAHHPVAVHETIHAVKKDFMVIKLFPCSNLEVRPLIEMYFKKNIHILL